MSVELVERGARLYVAGDTYAIKDRLKEAGCHWDGERRQWWIGKGKRKEIEALLDAPPPSKAEVAARRLEQDRNHITGRASFNGHDYYVVGDGHNERGGWVRLMFRDGSKTFYKDVSEVEITKSYEKPRTLAALQEFARQMREGNDECACREPGCCIPRCRCTEMCACRGGPVFDCLG
jgi:hypothetical protein